MNTNTRSTDHPSLLSADLFGDGYVDDEPDCYQEWPTIRSSRHDLMNAVDRFGETPSGRWVLHNWAEYELLADALELIAEGPRVDPLLLRARDLAAAFGTDLFDNLNLGDHGRSLLPDLVAAFVPYAHALRGRPAHATAAALGVIDGCREAFVDPEEGEIVTRSDPWRRSLDRWRPPPPPTPRELLIREVGSEDVLVGLSTEPLPDEDVDLSRVPDDVRARLRETLDLADPVMERVFGIEHRTAVRRLLVDAIVADPEILRRKGRTQTLAAGACLAVARADRQLQPEGDMKALTLAEQFGLSGGSTSRESTLQKAVAGIGSYRMLQPLPPRYLTGRRRTELVTRRDELTDENPVRRAS